MATAYRHPHDIPDPPDFDEPRFRDGNGRYDFEAHLAAEEQWVEQVSEWCKANSPSDMAGEVVRFPQGDGYAVYVVHTTKPLALIHCPVGDAWQIPDAHMRGLRTYDIRKHVEARDRLNQIFGRTP